MVKRLFGIMGVLFSAIRTQSCDVKRMVELFFAIRTLSCDAERMVVFLSNKDLVL